jgi:ATP-dependent Lhr-like helicase
VRCEADEIGTITTPPPVGDRFALAGRVWEVEELDIAHKLIYVKGVEGKMEVSWPGDYGEIHTRILERMKQVLLEDTVYPYLKPNAQKRLDLARHVARNTGMLQHSLVHLGGFSYCLFPWLGTRSFRAMRKLIATENRELGINGLEYEGCYYLTFKMSQGTPEELIARLSEKLSCGEVNAQSLVSGKEIPVFEKYDDYVPADLLRHAYAVDKINLQEAGKRIFEIAAEQ